MACRQDSMLSRPICYRLHETFRIELSPQPKQHIAGRRSLVAQIVPQGWVQAVRLESVTLHELLVERVRPDSSLCPVERRLIKECGGDRLAKRFRKMFVILPMRVLHEKANCISIQIIHIGIAINHTSENHQSPTSVPSTQRRRPREHSVLDIGAKAYAVLLHGTVACNSHQGAWDSTQVKRELAAWRQSILHLIQTFDCLARMIVHERGHSIPVDCSHAATGESVFVVKRHLGTQFLRFGNSTSIEGEIIL